MGRHHQGVTGRWRAWRRLVHHDRAELRRRRQELRDQAEYQERLLHWKKRRARLVADGLLPDEAQAETGPMPAPPPGLVPAQRTPAPSPRERQR